MVKVQKPSNSEWSFVCLWREGSGGDGSWLPGRLQCVILLGWRAQTKRRTSFQATGVSKSLSVNNNNNNHHHHHHHHWLDSPGWALAFHRSLCHSSLLITTSLQFLMSTALISWTTPSSHLNLGLPIFLDPHDLELKTFWTVHWGSIRTTCPHQRSLFVTLISDNRLP
jgi:hypothetical protein